MDEGERRVYVMSSFLSPQCNDDIYMLSPYKIYENILYTGGVADKFISLSFYTGQSEIL
jgi:hypothetical protein